MVNRTIDQVYSGDPNTDEKKVNIFTVQHETIYKTAFKIFKDNIIIGIGPKNFRKVCLYPEFNKNFLSCSTHPHNIYLQLLSETGIVVFVSVLYIFLFSCYKIISLYFDKSRLREDNEIYFFKFFSTLGLFINLLPFSTSGNFFNNWFSILLFFVFSFFLISNNVRNLR